MHEGVHQVRSQVQPVQGGVGDWGQRGEGVHQVRSQVQPVQGGVGDVGQQGEGEGEGGSYVAGEFAG